MIDPDIQAAFEDITKGLKTHRGRSPGSEYVLMPKEATRTMTMAGCDSLPSCEHVFGYAGEMLRNAYRKMVEVGSVDVAQGWRDISTAPPAGTVIDVWMVLPSGHGARWTSVMWGDMAQRWIGGPPSQDSQGWKATHWMRVPGSPSVPSTASEGAT